MPRWILRKYSLFQVLHLLRLCSDLFPICMYVYTLPLKSLGLVRFFMFLKEVSSGHQGWIYLIKNTVKNVHFKMYSWVTWSFGNHSNMLIWCCRKKMYSRIFWMNWKLKEHNWIKIEVFCNINIFTVNFDQYNSYLLNKSIIFFKSYWT